MQFVLWVAGAFVLVGFVGRMVGGAEDLRSGVRDVIKLLDE